MSRITPSAFVFFLLLHVLLPVNGAGQGSACGPVVENFNSTSGSTAGFSGSLTFASSGSNGFLLKKKVLASAVYPVTTPTYQLPADAANIGFGFSLDGTENVAKVDVKVLYVSTYTDEVTTVALDRLFPLYTGTAAAVCSSVPLADLPGFPAGGKYRLQVDLIPASGTGNAAQTISFDGFQTNGTFSLIPLPVHFTGLQAKRTGGAVLLTWTIAGEENVARYEVERSADGRAFVVMGAVTKTGAICYNLTDAGVPGTVYYRVRNVDNDGRLSYSPVVRVAGDGSDVVLKAFPLPVKERLTVQHPAAGAGAVLQVNAANGGAVRRLQPAVGSLQTVVEMAGLPAGLYLVRFADGAAKAGWLTVVKE